MIGERESHMEYMKRRIKEETLCDYFMSPMDAAKRIRALEQRLDELEGALVAERNAKISNE
jgi:hypothetical protein